MKSGSSTWTPPLLSFGTGSVGFLFALASYFVFTSIPKAGEIAKGIISSKMPNLESGINDSMAPINSAWGNYVKPIGANTAGEFIGQKISDFEAGGVRTGPWYKQRILQPASKGVLDWMTKNKYFTPKS